MTNQNKSELRIEQIVVGGPFASNCYLLVNKTNQTCIVIDPGGDGDTILETVKRQGLEVTTIWLTHGHLDHLGSTAQILSEFKVPVWIHDSEKGWCSDAEKNGSNFFGMRYEPFDATDFWADGNTVEGHGLTWEIHHIPGHSPGGVVILNCDSGIAFSGDLVMYGAIGRTDLPGSNPETFVKSLKDFFSKNLPDNLKLYPGHGDATTFAAEKSQNPYVKAAMENNLRL